MTLFSRYRTHSVLAGLLALSGAAITTACTVDKSRSGDVHAHPRLITMSQALAANTLTSMHGSYSAGCTARNSGSWTLTISGTAGNDELSVVEDNTDCVLTLTSVKANATTYVPTSPSSIALDGTFKETAVAFYQQGGNSDVVEFYGNAKLDPADFSSDFGLVFKSSDEINDVDGGQHDALVSVAGAQQASTIEAPNYEYASGIVYSENGDAGVTGATGSVTLTLPQGGYAANYYRIVDGSSLGASPSFNQVDDAFRAGSATAMPSSPASFTWEQLGLTNGAVLPMEKTIIVQRIDSATNVVSYQTFWLRFNAVAQ